MKVKYCGIPYISPWAYTLVAVFCGLIHGVGLYTGGLHTGVSEALEFSSKIADVHLFSQIIMYFNDFRATWAYTRGGAYTRVLKLRSESGRF